MIKIMDINKKRPDLKIVILFIIAIIVILASVLILVPEKEETPQYVLPGFDINQVEWKEGNHSWSYPHCMALTRKDIAYCEFVEKEDIQECKDMVEAYKTLKDPGYRTEDENLAKIIDAIKSGDQSICASLEEENRYCRILADRMPPEDCNAIEGMDVCDEWYEARALLKEQKSFCSKIKSPWQKTECIFLGFTDESYCRNKVKFS